MARMQDLVDVCTHTFNGVPQLDIPDEHTLNVEKFYTFMVQHATECVRDVLRKEGTTLTYEAANEVQNRLIEFFEVSW